jgi:WD40 repeat protein/beta-lactamase regulating signal transducer with metallopeptidase domain
VEIGLANALLATLLAVVALLVGRYTRRPALIHALWLLVLIKLLTPPLIRLPLPVWSSSSAPTANLAPLDPEENAAKADNAPMKAIAMGKALPTTPISKTPVEPAPFMRIEDIAKADMAPPVVMPAPANPPQPLVDPAPRVVEAIPLVTPTEDVIVAVNEPQTAGWPGVLDLIAVVWLGGAAFWLGLAAWRIMAFQRMLRHAKPAPEDLQKQAAELAQKLGLSRCPTVWLVPGQLPPLLWAFAGRARVFFPESLLPKIDESGRAALLVHELAHLARRDHWVRWIELFACALYWWYPLTWWVRNRLHSAEEECCDAWVTSELPGYGAAYAGALLDTIDFLSPKSRQGKPIIVPVVASGFGKMHELKKRLSLIVGGSTPRGLSLAGKVLLLVVALALPFTPTPGQSAAPPVSSTTEEKPDKPAQASSGDKAPPVKPDAVVGVKPRAPVPVTPAAFVPREPEMFAATAKMLASDGGQVWATAVSPDGKTLAVASGSSDPNKEGALTLYDLPSGKERITRIEAKPIRSVAYSADGRHLATGDFESNLKLRDPKTGETRRTLSGHSAGINAIAFTPGDKQVITASLDKTLKIWNVDDATLFATLAHHTDWVLNVAISKDGKKLLSVSKDQTGAIWDLKTRKVLHTLKGHNNWVEGCAFTNDSKFALTTGNDAIARLWDVTKGQLVREFTGHAQNINCAVFSADDKTLYTAGNDQLVNIWDVATAKLEGSLTGGHSERIYTISLSPDGQTIYSGSWDKKVNAWDIADRKVTQSFQPTRYREELNYPLLGVALSPDGKTLAVCGEERAVKLLDPITGQVKLVLEGHEDVVAGVAFSPDGALLATAGYDAEIRLFDVKTGKTVHKLEGHENWVYAVTFSPDGKYLASAGYDKTVKIWDVATGKLIETIAKHKGSVRAVAFSPDGAYLATGASDKSIRLWNVGKWTEHKSLRGHDNVVRAVAFSPDGTKLASGSEDSTLRLWNLETEKELAQVKFTSEAYPRALAFTPRGTSLVVGGQDTIVTTYDPTTLQVRGRSLGTTMPVTAVTFAPDASQLYTVSLDRSIRTWQGVYPARQAMTTFLSPTNKQFWTTAFSPDGKFLAHAGGDGRLTVRESGFGRSLGELANGMPAVYNVCVSPDGNTVAAGCLDGAVRIYDLRTRKLLTTLKGGTERVWTSRFSPDGKKLLTASGSFANVEDEGEVRIWDIAENKVLLELRGHTASTQSVDWSADGKTIIVGARDGTGRIYEAESGKELLKFESAKSEIRSLAFAPDGKYFAGASADGSVYIWATQTGKLHTKWKVDDRGCNCVAWSPDGKMLAVCSKPGSDQNLPGLVKTWMVDAAEGEGPNFKEKATLKGLTRSALGVAISPDGKLIAACGGMYQFPGEAVIWDANTGAPVARYTGQRQWVESVCFTNDSRSLITGGGTRVSFGEIRLYDCTRDGGWVADKAHAGEIMAAVWSPDGKTIFTAGSDKVIKIWNAQTGEALATLSGHKDQVRVLAISPDGKFLASGAADRAVKLWDLKTRTETAELAKHTHVVTSVAFSPDGKRLASSSADPFGKEATGEVKVVEIDSGREVEGADWSKRMAMSVAYSPDGHYLTTGAAGPQGIVIYDAKSGKQVAVAQATNVRAITYSKDGKTLVSSHGTGSARGNGSLQVFDTTTWKETQALTGHTSLVLGLAISPDGKTLATASNDTTVKVWDISQ